MYSTLSLSARSASPPPEPYTSTSLSAGSASGSGDEIVVGRSGSAARSGSGGGGRGGGRKEEAPGGIETRERRGSADGKADQILQHFYSKTVAVIFQSRATHPENSSAGASPSSSSITSPLTSGGLRRAGSSSGGGVTGVGRKTNRWFNLELPDIPDCFRPSLRTFRSISSLPPSDPIPPLILTVYLDTSTLSANQVLTLASPTTGKRIRVPPVTPNPSSGSTTPSGNGNTRSPNVVLERWELRLEPGGGGEGSIELPTVYKSSILHFRTLYTLLRALPTFGLYRKLARIRVGGAGLVVGVRVGEGGGRGEMEVGLEEGIWGEGEGRGEVVERFVLGSVGTPLGTLHLSTTYRLNTDFAIEAIETLLSSTFIDQDFFTRPPTFVRSTRISLSQQLQSSSSLRGVEEEDGKGEKKVQSALSRGRPGSLPTTGAVTTLPSNSPPRIPLPLQRRISITGGGGGGGASYGSLSSRHPFPTSLPPSGNVGSGSGTTVEPAFVSLSRARGLSYTGSTGAGVGGILRAVPISSSPSSSSPIFRTSSSYLSSSASSSPHPHITTGPTSNIHRVSSSPLVPPSSSYRPPPTPIASPPQPMSMRQHSSSFSGGGGGSYSRSYGRTSSQGSEASGTWNNRDVEPTKKFLNPSSQQEDAEDINDFLGLIDRRPSITVGGLSGGSVILSKEMAEEQLKKLAGSGFLTGEREMQGRLAAALRSKGSRLSIEEETAQGLEEERGGRVQRSSGLAGTSITTTQRYFSPTTASVAQPIPSSMASSPSSSPRFPPYVPSQHQRTRSLVTTMGFDVHPSSTSPSPSISRSGSNIISRSGGVVTPSGGGDSSTASLSGGERSYGGEEEAVGRLELGEEDEMEMGLETEGRGRGWDEREDAGRERDMTPGQGGAGRNVRPPSLGYRRWGVGRGDSPPEISWMG